MNRLAAIALVLVTCVAPARAQPKLAPAPASETPQQRASKLFEEAQRHYEAARYREAIPLLEQAYQLVHDPVYLFNLGQAYRKLFDCVTSSNYYARYLAEATDADAKQREKIQVWIKELAPCVDQRKREATEDAKLREQAAAAGQSGPKYIEHDPGRPYRLGAYAAGGVGAIGLAVGVVFAKRGSDLKSEVRATCSDGCEWTAELEAKDRRGSRANTIAAVSWIGSGASIAAGAVLYYIGHSKKIERIQVTPSTGGASVSVRGRF
ncbi:MAG TPA: hypothetical protein VFQ53_16345 [Kofleriaceae bacterium]|nr:hypothetical protein [Kofleriaceae bacterium]